MTPEEQILIYEEKRFMIKKEINELQSKKILSQDEESHLRILKKEKLLIKDLIKRLEEKK